jgi:hypothetical protein
VFLVMVDLTPPEDLKPSRRGVLDIAVPKISLQRPGINPIIRRFETAGMAKHESIHLP